MLEAHISIINLHHKFENGLRVSFCLNCHTLLITWYCVAHTQGDHRICKTSNCHLTKEQR